MARALKLTEMPSRYLGAEPRPDLLRGVYIAGDAGVGKTYAACGAIRAFVETHVIDVMGTEVYRGPRAKFVCVPDWFAMMRSTYSNRSEDEREVYEKYAKSGFLVLDDLGKGAPSEWASERVYMLLEHRYGNELPTIITSNYTLNELAARLSSDKQTRESIVSRIAGMCEGVRMDGNDRRLRC